MAQQKVNTSPPKGTRDFLPTDVRRREYVTRIIREVYEAHGFEPLETPTFERLDTLLGKYGEEGDQLVFKILHRGQPMVTGVREAAAFLQDAANVFTGRSGETAPGAEKLLADMGLRYDLTVPLARVVAEYQGQLPPIWRRYQIQPVWRADTPGKGRFREFYQCDVDVVGSKELIVEAEVCGAVSACMRRLGFRDFELRINHRGLLRAMIERAGIAAEKESEAIVAIDKLDKIGADGVRKELGQKGIAVEAQEALMGFVLGGADALKDLPSYAEIQRVIELSQKTPAAEHIKFDPTLARGLGYYTGCIFELVVKDLAGSLGGGGRYDGLVGMFLGRDVPACGFSLGLERILVVMEERKMFPAGSGVADAVVAAVDAGGLDRALALAYRLRESGLKIELVPKADKPGKVRKSADDRGVPHAVLVFGDKEELNVWSKSDADRTDRFVSADELAAVLRS